MKIAVVGPSPVPFTIGGAENLLWGVCDSINRYTPHQAELIKLPLRELNFWDLIESYQDFYQLDLSHFDQVIVTKYPSWMVRHPNKICYMIHTLRGLYDTYFSPVTEVKRGIHEVDAVLDYMEANPCPTDLGPFFELLLSLRDASVPEEYFIFPGSLIRKIIHYLDYVGLSEGVQKYAAISDTVKKRTDYFPDGASVETIYPPSTLTEFTTGEYQHLFMVSRLDGPKRIDMLIKAMKYVKEDIKLYIAGTGPEEEKLKELSKGDARIEMLGFVSDEEVQEYYANSLVIPYFPYDEDYGLITIEAMMRKKPVITTLDAGGPNEFVVNGETGFVTEFDAQKIGDKISWMIAHPQEAVRMGENAYQKVKEITWENMAARLLSGTGKARKRLTVTSTFPIYPPQGGGQARIYDLYKNVARYMDVEIESFGAVNEHAKRNYIASGLTEDRTAKSERHQQAETVIEQQVGIPITDIGMITLSGETPQYGEKLAASIKKSAAVVISHPYLYPEAKKYLSGKPFVYEAHNVEFYMKKAMLPQSQISKELLRQVFEVEKECCEKSAFIITCSEEDRQALTSLYGIGADKILVVPNGVDTTKTCFVSMEERMRNKCNAGLQNETIGIFMGSWHGPNLEACEKIFEIAPLCPNVKFVLLGSQCGYFGGRRLPENVGLMGIVEESVKNKIFALADFALNPMLSGSGTNLKMFDYMAAGLPIITTEFGTRGIDSKELFLIAEPVEEMADRIKHFDLKKEDERIIRAREYVEKKFDWTVISKPFEEKLMQLMEI
ncbi:glycosyltransferase family 4 protein [Christensenella timonensis]|uniref:glycosyltransferase family 4 protein n=1 Tax=Christensenella timonensis TaxID=1816678 RepID=UPI00082D3A37|nr:glycosyltransferase family 4 protein [Christensenella timonensis]